MVDITKQEKSIYFHFYGIVERMREFISKIDTKCNDIQVVVNECPDGTIMFYCNTLFDPKNTPDFKFYFSFKLAQMPGNCGIMVSYNMDVGEEVKNNGIAQFLQEIKEEIARQSGYTQMYCTTISTNKPQNHILEKYGWKKVNTFVNRRTGNTCFEWIKEVNYEKHS